MQGDAPLPLPCPLNPMSKLAVHSFVFAGPPVVETAQRTPGRHTATRLPHDLATHSWISPSLRVFFEIPDLTPTTLQYCGRPYLHRTLCLSTFCIKVGTSPSKKWCITPYTVPSYFSPKSWDSPQQVMVHHTVHCTSLFFA